MGCWTLPWSREARQSGEKRNELFGGITRQVRGSPACPVQPYRWWRRLPAKIDWCIYWRWHAHGEYAARESAKSIRNRSVCYHPLREFVQPVALAASAYTCCVPP